MRAKYMDLIFTLCYVILFATHISAYSSTSNGKGRYKTYNAKKSLSAVETKRDPEKLFLGSMSDNSRAPSHDTPASPCKCSKYTRELLKQKRTFQTSNRF